MTSKIKVDNINKVSDDSTIIKKCGSTTTVGSGAGQTIVVDGATVTLGRCGGAVNLASGASQTGFGKTGAVDWQTTPKTSTFTAVNGEGYFVDTSSGAITANLPAGSAGAIIAFADYAKTFDTNGLTLSPNGTDKIRGIAGGASLTTEGQGTTIIFVDSTQGWIDVIDSTASLTGNDNLVASGGTVTTSGDYKIHSFTGPGTFSVSQVSQTAADNVVSYAVVAGGGGSGGGSYVGGAGGGGFREFRGTNSGCYAVSPLNGSTPITVTAQAYPITVGGGGGSAGSNWVGGAGAGGFREFRGTNSGCYAVSPLNGSTPITVTATNFPITVGGGGAGGAGSPAADGVVGNASTFSTVTSAGGGFSVKYAASGAAPSGGSGAGGTANSGTSGSGNTPPVSPPQGSSGGTASGNGGAGGGGAGGVALPRNCGGAGGGPGPCSVTIAGGASVPTSITGSAVDYSQGGIGIGGSPGGFSPSPNSGAANTGKGGSGATAASGNGGTGGSGIVVIRYKFQ